MGQAKETWIHLLRRQILEILCPLGILFVLVHISSQLKLPASHIPRLLVPVCVTEL